MYFKKLELVGFKSFLDKTTLHFEPGITAIVGPNGCGKSNIFDSIRWVLGEQSVKALRGSEMQDVIFNGTDSKEPLSMAEVTLCFDNEKRYFPIDHHEVSVTRRIFRSGESEYLLNKTQVRLKDILDLLLGTGIGAESYSLVEQGKIDLVLSSRPEDRRLVFDEASGITKYKTQKREALKKLEETEQNLLRVNDIITEVKRQIGSLERQANKARRYKEIFEELKQRETYLAVFQNKTWVQEKEKIAKALSEIEARAIELESTIKEDEAKIIQRQEEQKALEEIMFCIKNLILGLENSISRNKERIHFNAERMEELNKNGAYLESQTAQTKNKLNLDEEELNNVKNGYAQIKGQISEKEELLKLNESELNNLAFNIKAALENITTAKKNILELAAKIANVKNEITGLSSKQQIHLARKKRLQLEKAQVDQEESTTAENLNQVTQEVKSLEGILETIALQINNLNGELNQEAQALSNLNTEIEALDKQRLALESQKEFLKELKTKYEDISESMNAMLYLDKMPSEKTAGIVIKIKDYLDLTAEDKQNAGFASIKANGEAKPIDLDAQKITEKILQIQQKLNFLKQGKDAKESRINELNNTSTNLREASRNQELNLANKRTFQQTIEEQFSKIKGEQDLLAIELEDIDQELAQLGEKTQGLENGLSGLEKEQRAEENLITHEQNSISLNSELKEKGLVTITRTKTEIQGLTKRIGSDEATLKILENTYQQDKENLVNLENQAREAEGKKQGLATETRELEKGISQIQEEIESKGLELKTADDKYAAFLNGAQSSVKRIEVERRELDTFKNQLYELQMQNKDIDFKILGSKQRLSQAYKVDLDAQESNFAQDFNEGLIKDEIQGLKEKVDAYGSVNLVAIEEYDELKKRYDFLSQQQNDLACAKDSLHEAIQKINRTTKKMFLETFEKVRAEFRNYFKLLFNGGDAQVFLIDEEDPLESGIEIICRPPGKKLQNVLLLSGGEKSLSAIALIFAIFKVKPAPFCILDEIDAALDEANVDRFSRMLQDFAQASQFIMITHNKKTITNANVMYGITMEESGISKIVSVKFAKDKETSAEASQPEPIARVL